ncbi:macro domain-containing protein [Candidatus Dependentiae bacterium]|nr:macro domain-containing protein [Candidatus Dependentiae bacterium]
MKKLINFLIIFAIFHNTYCKEVFNFPGNKKIIIDKGDITKSTTDAIVNAANEDLAGGAGVCGAIFNAAGWDKLQKACDVYKKKGRVTCPAGQARITDSFNLQKRGIRHIIHAVGPDCRIITNQQEQDTLLKSAYENSLKIAEEYTLNSIAFPFISSAIYAFPKQRASRIALLTCIEMLKMLNYVKEVHFVLFSQDDYDLFLNQIKRLRE